MLNWLVNSEKSLEDVKTKVAESADELAANVLLGQLCAVRAAKSELKMYLSLKAEAPDQAWDHLIDAQDATAAAIAAHAGFAHHEVNIRRLREIEKLLFPKQTFLSAGFLVDRFRCSICQADYEQCGHIAGIAYMGEFCSRIAEGATAEEVSFVEHPADKRCRVTSFSTNSGSDRNPMTWALVVPPELEQAGLSIHPNVLAVGGSRLLRRVAAPLAATLSKIASQNLPALPSLPTNIRADSLLFSGLIGIFGFVGSWAATKVLDEALGRRVTSLIARRLRKLAQIAGEKKEIALCFILHCRHDRKTVVIASYLQRGHDPHETLITARQLAASLEGRHAISERDEAVLLFVARHGKAGLTPAGFPTLASAIAHVADHTAIDSIGYLK